MIFNPIICPVRNNLMLTRKALKTFQAQDVYGGPNIIIINNASTDGTAQFLQIHRDVMTMTFDPPLSVAESWNRALSFVFKAGAEYAFVVNNDVELKPESYRLLVEDGGGFVTLVGVREWPAIIQDPNPDNKRPHPDFSAFLIRKQVYETVGPFDENFKIAFGEDWDMHVRLHKAGITAYCIDYPFLHHGSQTIKNAELAEVRKIQAQAERNREYFRKKWGMAGASQEYYDFFGTKAP